MNLKPYYDAAIAAEAKVQDVLNRMDAHFQADEKEQALELRPELEEAKIESQQANELYATMRDGAQSTGVAQNFIPVNGKMPEEEQEEKTRMTRSAFNALDARERMAFIRSGGNVVDDDEDDETSITTKTKKERY